jgi:hypothetical protein
LKLNEFELVYFRPFSHFLSRLSHEQRNAIISVSFALHSDTTDVNLKQQGKAWDYAIWPDRRKGTVRNKHFNLDTHNVPLTQLGMNETRIGKY